MGIGMATLRLKARELVDNLKLLQLGSVEASKFSR